MDERLMPTTQQIVDMLDAIDADDPERAHSDADKILLACVEMPVRLAYLDIERRAKWWASA